VHESNEEFDGMPPRSWKPIEKKARHGFRGYPIATVAFYGPNDAQATKVAVGIVLSEDENCTDLERWFADKEDVRNDWAIGQAVADFIQAKRVRTVVVTDGIIGCPHEEGVDYPVGESCPHCLYWAGRDRWTGKMEK
jgi:hypothetical protein